MANKEFGRPRWPLSLRIKFWLITQLAGRLLVLIFKTCRVEILNRQIYEEYFEGKKANVAVSWHRGGVFAAWKFGRFHPAFMVSRSKDGELAAGFCRLVGAVPVRGSSSKGGSSALRELERVLKANEVPFAATVADGPQGPAYVAKSGLAVLASRTGRPLVPVMWSADRAWAMKNSWDKHMIPKPFAKVLIAVGEPIPTHGEMSSQEVEQLRQQMQDQLNQLTKLVDDRCGYKDPE